MPTEVFNILIYAVGAAAQRGDISMEDYKAASKWLVKEAS